MIEADEIAALRTADPVQWFRKVMALYDARGADTPWWDTIPDYRQRQSSHNQKWDRLRAWENAGNAVRAGIVFG